MLQDGITLPDSAIATNFQIQHGTTLPLTGLNEGEMFYLTAVDGANAVGLYVATAGTWHAATSISATIALTNLNQTFTKAQRGAVVALTPGATVALDLSLSNNFSLAAAQNFTLANPTNAVAGQSGLIAITQDATGSRVLTLGSQYVKTGGTLPVLTTAGASVDYLMYYVESATRIFVSLAANVKA